MLLMAIWLKNYSVYGKRKLWAAAKRAGEDVGREQVARIMRQLGIRGVSRAKRRFTTHADATHLRAPDLVKRNFTASRPDELWVADFTYCSTWSGVIYVAFVIDVFSRRIVGWKASRSMTADLVIAALDMAAWTRRHSSLEHLTCHTDAGSQGEFKRSSQHLEYGGVYGKTGRMDERTNWASTDEVARIPGTPQRGRERVLASCGHGNHERSSSGSCRRVPSGRHSLVPASWWNATESSCTSFGPVFVL